MILTILLILGGIILSGAVTVVAALALESVYPYKLPVLTMSNGRKTVTFEGMFHIASSRFYDSVKHDLQAAREDGAVYYYERIKKGKHPESMEGVTGLISGGSFDKDTTKQLYQKITGATGLIYQPQDSFIEDGDLNVDADADDIYQMVLETAPVTGVVKQKIDGKEMNDKFEQVRVSFSKLPPSAKSKLKIIARNSLSLFFRCKKTAQATDGIVLDYRNRILSDAILSGPEKIIVTYGKNHIDGVLQNLKKADPDWRVISRVSRPVFQ